MLRDPWFWAFLAALGWFVGLLVVGSKAFGTRPLVGVLSFALGHAIRSTFGRSRVTHFMLATSPSAVPKLFIAADHGVAASFCIGTIATASDGNGSPMLDSISTCAWLNRTIASA